MLALNGVFDGEPIFCVTGAYWKRKKVFQKMNYTQNKQKIIA